MADKAHETVKSCERSRHKSSTNESHVVSFNCCVARARYDAARFIRDSRKNLRIAVDGGL